MIAQARADGIPMRWLEAARKEPGLQDGGDWKVALPAAPGIPHAADGLVRPAAVADHGAANAGHVGTNGEIPTSTSCAFR